MVTDSCEASGMEARVDVWYTFFDEGDDGHSTAAWQQVLVTDELAVAAEYSNPAARMQFLAGRALLRSVLSRYLGLPPQQVRLCAGLFGKPHLDISSQKLHFNLAHTRGIAVCGVTRHGEIGVDVERHDRRINLQLAHRYFAPEEVESLNRLPLQEQPRRFLELWTLKEAFVKAVGTGLRMPLDSFAFHISSRDARLLYCQRAGLPSDWLAVQFPLGATYQVALVVQALGATRIGYQLHPWTAGQP